MNFGGQLQRRQRFCLCFFFLFFLNQSLKRLFCTPVNSCSMCDCAVAPLPCDWPTTSASLQGRWLLTLRLRELGRRTHIKGGKKCVSKNLKSGRSSKVLSLETPYGNECEIVFQKRFLKNLLSMLPRNRGELWILSSSQFL